MFWLKSHQTRFRGIQLGINLEKKQFQVMHHLLVNLIMSITRTNQCGIVSKL